MQPHTKLSEFFTYGELIYSQTAERLKIDNRPGDVALAQLRRTAAKLDLVRRRLGKPVNVTSGFRCLELNRAIGSKDDSQHIPGMAADILSPLFGTVTQIFNEIKGSPIPYDQLIREFHLSPSGGWIHISFVDGTPRRQAFDIN